MKNKKIYLIRLFGRAALRRNVCRLVFLVSIAGILLASFNPAASQTGWLNYIPLVVKPYPSLSGIVVDANGPVAGATVRVQTTDQVTTTSEDGRFTLYNLVEGVPITITAWATGYYNGGGVSYLPGAANVEIFLQSHSTEDNPDYDWLSAFTEAGQSGNCQNCHSDANGHLPFEEWLSDAHSQTTNNLRFLTMYTGSDIFGNQSPETRYFCQPDYGCFPLPPDPDQPYYGPGYLLDFPDTAGNCATCHAPAAAINAPYTTDPTTVTGVGAEGVACDFCHKVYAVKLDPSTGLPYANNPGVLSYEYRRPPDGHQFFAGPFDDVAPFEDTYSPPQTQSQYCAPCHFGVFWNVTIYNSFGEWLDSAYSDPLTGRTCQDCHMPVGLNDHFALLSKGGLLREPSTIFSHRMPGAVDQQILQNAVTLTAGAVLSDGLVLVDVSVTNDQTGHNVPTDSPLRQMILLVQAFDENEQPLALVSGPTLPSYAGEGDPDQGYYSGQPGLLYARILREMWTDVVPTGAYWTHVQEVSDTRLAALTASDSNYSFAAPSSGQVTIQVSLLYRRAYRELADWKSWEIPDILMEETTITLYP